MHMHFFRKHEHVLHHRIPIQNYIRYLHDPEQRLGYCDDSSAVVFNPNSSTILVNHFMTVCSSFARGVLK